MVPLPTKSQSLVCSLIPRLSSASAGKLGMRLLCLQYNKQKLKVPRIVYSEESGNLMRLLEVCKTGATLNFKRWMTCK